MRVCFWRCKIDWVHASRWVDIQVFVGFLLAMLMNKLIEHQA